TPDAFHFTDVTGVAPGAVVVSAAVTITGILAPAPVSVSGGSYSIGCTGTFTAAGGSISNNQTLCARHTASSSGGGVVDTLVTVGGVSDTFSSTAAAPDHVPDAFHFADAFPVGQSVVVRSNFIAITGINVPAAVSVD